MAQRIYREWSPATLTCCLAVAMSDHAVAVHVDDFGAIGDGAIWDHSAIQAAIEAAGPGGDIEFSPGKTYIQCQEIEPLEGQTLLGRGATLKRCDSPIAFLTRKARPQDNVLEVDNPGAFELGQFLTPAKNAGGIEDGEAVVRSSLISISGRTLTLSRALGQGYPVGSPVTVKFNQIRLARDVVGVTVDHFIFDGNRRNNNVFLAWTDNSAIHGTDWLTVTNSVFEELPSNGIMLKGTGVVIDNNVFRELNGPMIHLSDNLPMRGSVVRISNNMGEKTNQEALRMGHSEGVITISVDNHRVQVVGNVVNDVDVPFIAPFHKDMHDWTIYGNTAIDTNGGIFGKVGVGAPLSNIEIRRNIFVNTSRIRLFRTDGGSIENVVFARNVVLGGSVSFDGISGGEVTNNRIKSCDGPPLDIRDSQDFPDSNNELATIECETTFAIPELYMHLEASTSTVSATGATVTFQAEVRNVMAQPVATIQSVSHSLDDGDAIAYDCSPAPPATLALGDIMQCTLEALVDGPPDSTQTAMITVTGRDAIGNMLTAAAAADIEIEAVSQSDVGSSGGGAIGPWIFLVPIIRILGKRRRYDPLAVQDWNTAGIVEGQLLAARCLMTGP